MYTFYQECETKKTSPIFKKKNLILIPPPKKKTLYTNEDELLLAVKLKLSSL